MTRLAQRSIRPALVLFVVAAALFSLTAQAPASTTPEDRWESVSLIVADLDGDGEPVLLVGAGLPIDTELPVEVALPVPRGGTVTGANEMTGDGQLVSEIEITSRDQRGDHDLLRFTMREVHYVHIEMSVPEGILTSTAEGTRIEFAWVAAGTADRARVGARMSLASHLEGVDPEPIVAFQPDEITYTVEKRPVEVGDRLEIAGTVVTGRAPELDEMMGTDGESPQAETGPEAEPETETAAPAPVDEITEPEDRPISTIVLPALLAGALLVAGTLLVLKIREGRKPPEA